VLAADRAVTPNSVAPVLASGLATFFQLVPTPG
jgi:hypothetical protein